MAGLHDDDLGSAVAQAIGAAVLLWIAGRLGLPANVRVFVYVVAGFIALFAAAHLIDIIWLAIKRRRD